MTVSFEQITIKFIYKGGGEMIGKRIKQIREEHGLSVEEFAKKIGIPAVRLEEIEAGKLEPCDATLVYISKLFNVNYWWLKEGKEALAGVG